MQARTGWMVLGATVTLGTFVLLACTLALFVFVLAGGDEGGDEGDDEGRPAAANVIRGAEVFASERCGDCHSLRIAGASGTRGPDLDSHLHEPHSVERLVDEIGRGGSGMPAYAGRLSEQELRDVAAFVQFAARPASG